jgi:hypothetical protein
MIPRIGPIYSELYTGYQFRKNHLSALYKLSRVSSGSIVCDYGLDDRAIDPRQVQRIFPLASVSRQALWPTQPPVQWVSGILSPGVKARRWRDADNSPPSSAEFENE